MPAHSFAQSSARHVVCAASEFVLLSAAFLAARFIRLGPEAVIPLTTTLLAVAVMHALALQVSLYYNDLYEDSAMRRRFELLARIGQAIAFAGLSLTAIYFMVESLKVGRGILLIYLPLATLVVVGWRSTYFWALGHEALVDNVLILGTGSSAQQIAKEMIRREHLGFRVVGFLGEHTAEVGRRLVGPSVIGTIADLSSARLEHNVSLIVVGLDDRRGKLPISELLQCRLAGVRVEEASGFFERLTGKIIVRNLRPSWLVFSQGFNKARFLRNSKRIWEFVMSGVLLLAAAPLLAVIAVLVRLSSPGPIFYRQQRCGEKGRPFMLLKFRTMRNDAEAASGPVWATAKGDARATPVGKFLRRTRLDELPQLINVSRGDMSFVGPRPERPHFVEQLRKIIPYYEERHSVKPGITGWAQIKFGYGSNIEDAEEKLQYDLYYVKHMSLRFDLGIMFDTLKVLVNGRGAR